MMAEGKDEATCPLTADNITPLGDFNFPTIPGKPFAKLKSDDLPAELSKGASKEVAFPGSHLVCDPKAGTVTATTVGMVSATETGLSIIPLWSASDDGMTLFMDIHPKDCFEDAISDDNYREWLPEGCHGVDNDVLDAAVAEAAQKDSVVSKVELAHGREPTQGREGQIKLSFREGGDVGTEADDGSINFRERGGMACVVEGEHVASLVPPTAGKPGIDVLGNELPANDGQPQTLKAGPGIATAGGSGATEVFTATMDGMVVHKDNTISVSDVLEINSDVDLGSGNVHVDKGSILIKGTVTTGAEVTAAENVIVEVVVENATIKAGADVTVAGGILMDEGGLIKAGGNVSAKFMRNATIRAGGDVIVDVDFVNCDIQAGGRIIAESDKGAVNGGTYTCAGMDVAEAGSDVGSPTDITLSLPGGQDSGIDDRIARIKEKIEELEKYIGTEDIKATLLMAPKEDRAILAELLKIKALLLTKNAKLDEKKAEWLEARGKELAKIRLKARKTAHAGTSITIANKTIKLTKAEQASKFHWDPEQGGIAITGN